ncbi:MAG TPA: PH domain-containing protein [Gemmatimonadota bacterium]|nr:PH domain-containing protein [Gemmatimonadota bacterium]
MEFAFPWIRWLLKAWFWIGAVFFFYLFWIDIFVHRWFILLWAFFSLGLGAYVAPAIRVDPQGLEVKYLWRYRRIPWGRVLNVQRTLLGAQILTVERNWAYRVVGYQFPMPGVGELVEVVEAGLRRRR